MRKFILVFALLISTLCIYAQTTENFNKAMDTRDVELARSEISKADKKTASKMEEQMMAEIKKAVAEDNLDYAYSLTEVVLEYDLDNVEAQKLYNSIGKAKKAKEETLKRQAEDERKRKEAEEQKKAIEEYQKAKVEEAQKKDEYIEQVSSITFNNFPLDIGVTPVSFNFAKSPFADECNANNVTNIRYGAGGVFKLGFVHPYFLATAKLNYTFFLHPLAGSGNKAETTLRTSFGIPHFSKWFRLCFSYDSYSVMDDDNSSLYSKVTSPKLGIGFEKVQFGENFEINTYFDIDFNTSDKNSDIQFAYGTELDMKYMIPGVYITNNGRLFVEADARYYTIRINNENEWNVNTSISVGVSFNE